MKNFYKIFMIIIFFLIFLTTHIYASSVVMDLDSDIINRNTINNMNRNNFTVSNSLNQNDEINNSYQNSSTNNEPVNSSTVQTSNPVVTTTSSNNNDFLTVENILSIAIIVIGILLIFLSIAILIRCKN